MISNVKKKIIEGIIQIRRKPMRLFSSLFIMVFMMILTAFAWDGMLKRLAICVGLTLFSVFFMLIPRLSNRISIPLLMLYLFFVPKRLFMRMEIPIHDISRIMDGVVILSIAFIICTYLLIFLFTQNSAAALGAGNVFFLVLFLIEYFIWKYRGSFLRLSDLGTAGTAVSVISGDDYILSSEAVYSVIYFLFFIVLGSRIRICMNKWMHIGISLFAILFIAGWCYIVMSTENPLGKEFIINYWVISDTRKLNGACFSHFLL